MSSAFSIVCAGLAYFAAVAVTFVFPWTNGVLDAVWPASGLALAILLLNPRSRWPALLGAFVIAHMAGDVLAHRPLVGVLGFTLAANLETFLAAWVFTTWRGEHSTFGRLADVLVLLGVASVVNAGTAVFGAAVAVQVSGASFIDFWRSWWIEDGLGFLLFTPLIVAWARREDREPFGWRKVAETIGATSAALALAWIYFVLPRSRFSMIHHSYVIVAPLVWAALRTGTRGTSVVMAVLAFVEVGATYAGVGSFPMSGDTPAERLLAVQLYLAVKCAISFLLAAAFAERRASEQELRRVNRALRTLSNSNQALVRAGHESELLNDVCRVIVEDGGFRFAWVGLVDSGAPRVRPAASAGVEERHLQHLLTAPGHESGLESPIDVAVRTEQPAVSRNYLADPAVAPWRGEAIRHGFKSSASLPLRTKKQVVGVLSIYAAEEHAFDQKEIALLTELADDLAFGIQAQRARAQQEEFERALEHSEALLQQFIKYTPAAVAMFDTEMRYLHASERWLADYDLVGQQIIGRSHYELFPNIPDRWKVVHQRVLAGAVERCEEDSFRRADGSMEWLYWEVRPWRRPDGAIGGLIIFAQLITERKRAVEALRASQAKLVMAMDMAQLGHWELDLASKTFTFDDDFYALHRTNAAREGGSLMSAETYGRKFVHPEDVAVVEREIALSVATADPGFTRQLEHRILRADGTTGVVQVRYAIEKDAEGRTVRSYGVNQDVTERRRSEEALRLSEERFRSAMYHSPIGMALVALDGRWLEVNPAMCAIVGYTRDDLLAMAFQDLTHPDDLGAGRDLMRRLLTRDLETYRMEKRYLHKAGHVVWAQVNVSLVWAEDGTPRHFVSQVQDITERRRTASALLALNERYARHEEALTLLARSYVTQPEDLPSVLQRIAEVVARTLDIAHVGVWRFTDGGRTLVCEEAFEASRSRHSAGHRLTADEHPELFRGLAADDHAAVDPSLVGGPIATGSLRPVVAGSFLDVPIRAQGVTVGVLACSRAGEASPWTPDEQTFASAVASLISALMAQVERQRVEAQLRQAQKLEAIGQLAGGVAHDFNNVLTVILGKAAEIVHDPRVPADLRASASDIAASGERAASLTRQLLAFSRRHTIQKEVVDLNATVRSIARMLQRILGEDVAVRLMFAPQPALVDADPGMIDQILLNLAVNARDAMPDGGHLTVETSLVSIDGDAPAGGSDARHGSFVKLRVTDTGCGIRPEHLPHIFEPFFTTKGVGKGTGLGLATTYGIVQQHNGWLDVESEPDRGTTFQVYLPAVDSVPAATNQVVSLPVMPGSGETILVVEDEDDVRSLVVEALVGYGYTVLDAPNGPQALEIWQGQRERIDLLLTDMVMPGGLNGLDLAGRLRSERPELKVIYTSGYLANVNDDGTLEEGTNYLPKPFRLPELARLVRRRLDSVV